MHSILFEFNSWRIRSYDVMLCLAITTGILLVLREARKEGYQWRRLFLCLVGTVTCALIGARINSWLFWFQGNFSMLDLNLSSPGKGMTAFGGFAGAFGFAALYSYLNHWNIWKVLDVIASVLPVTEGIQRIGCLLNGCCYGSKTGGFLGIYLPDILGYWAYRYPTQIITGIFCVLLFYWLWSQRKNKLFEGMIFLHYLLIYHVGRLAIDFLRGDEPVVLGLLTAHQLTAAVVATIATIILYLKLRKGQSGTGIQFYHSCLE